MFLLSNPGPSRNPADQSARPEVFAKVVARRYHLHAPGIVYTFVSILIVLGAINGQNNLLFWAFGLAVAGMLVSGFLSGMVLMGVQVRRETLYPADAGSPLLVRYTIRNKNRLMPSFALTIEELDRPKRRRPSSANWFRLMPRPVAFVPHIAPRDVVVVDAAVSPWSRGTARFDAFRVSTTFPFGLTFKSVVFAQPQEVRVRPWRPMLLPGALRRLLSQAGNADRSVAKRGVGEETYALREYRQGESSRAIAWKPTARHDRPIVRETAQRSPASICVAVGNASSPLARERVVSLVAALAAKAAANGLDVGVSWPEVGLSLAPSASPTVAGRILDALAEADEDSHPAHSHAAITRCTRIVIHDGPSFLVSTGGGITLSVDDPMLTDPHAWQQAPLPPEWGAKSERLSIWKRLARVLGGLG